MAKNLQIIYYICRLFFANKILDTIQKGILNASHWIFYEIATGIQHM